MYSDSDSVPTYSSVTGSLSSSEIVMVMLAASLSVAFRDVSPDMSGLLLAGRIRNACKKALIKADFSTQ